MQPSSKRRVYSAEFKATVMAECEHPGASVAAVSLAHGLNVNLVRKWLVGRGIKRSGLTAPRSVGPGIVAAREPKKDSTAATSMQFVPVELAHAVGAPPTGNGAAAAEIHVEVQRGAARLTVRWPASQAAACAAWLREFAPGALK